LDLARNHRITACGLW